MSLLKSSIDAAKAKQDADDAIGEEQIAEYDDFLREQEAKKDKGLSDEGYFVFKSFLGM